jgi:hypothetical protein
MPESFDEAFPGGFEECVSTLGQEDSVDDPEALCGWLQENGFEAIQSENPDDILASLEVEYVSVVDEPAQDSEWLVAKSAQADPDEFDPTEDPLRDGEFVVNKQSEEPERKVWAAVLIPGEVDKQGDLVPEPEIERAAHNYLKHYRKVDEDHDLVDGSGEPIESYVLKQETTFDLPDGSESRTYPKGTWIMGVQLTDDAWKRVESGELTGFSIYGGAASLEPGDLLTEEQKEVLLSMEQTQKAVEPEDLMAAVEAWSEATGNEPEEATAVELLEWVQENPDYDDDGGDEDESEEEPEADGDYSDDDEQESSKESETPGDGGDSDGGADPEQEKDTMGDENPDDPTEEQNDKLDELLEKTNSVQESVEETRKSVESVRDRVDELEQEVFEKDEGGSSSEEEPTDDLDAEEVEEAAEKAVEKALRDAFDVPDDEEGDLSEVVRKGSAFPDPDHDSGEDENSIELDYSGVVAGEEV